MKDGGWGRSRTKALQEQTAGIMEVSHKREEYDFAPSLNYISGNNK
jgi:hypothetical protein